MDLDDLSVRPGDSVASHVNILAYLGSLTPALPGCNLARVDGTLAVRDSFAGAGGWDIAVRRVFGVDAHGIELMPEARATRRAAGLATTHTDVRTVVADPHAYDLDISSPPCQTFSLAGHGAGRYALDIVLWAIRRYGQGRPPSARRLTSLTGDERTALVLEPLRLALEGRSMFLAWEQVPPVLPVWKACAEVLQQIGYKTWVGIVNSEQYGVPQTRKRAVLIARRDGVQPALPIPTHSLYHTRTPERLDAGVKPWVSMAHALGWQSEFYAVSNYGSGGNPHQRGRRLGSQPFASVTSKVDRVVLHHGNMVNSVRRHSSEPAGTLAFGHNAAKWAWDGTARLTIEEAALLQGFPPGHAFQGARTKQFVQIGNAIPPPMAEAILRTFL